ncbi:MAG: peroxidase-related enzyme [Pseudomonadales bacterium]|nr:peroxidase-related enzyme [Pseudomonadales bacterium]
MSDQAKNLFPFAELENIEPDIRERIEAVQEKAGFVPNIFLALAGRPEEFRAFFAYHDALMEKPGNLTAGEKEMIVVVTSGLNQCLYCVVAHGAILRIREKNPLIADQLATNYRKADITPKQRAMLDYAVKVSQSAQEVCKDDHQQLQNAGFTPDDIWEIGAIAAFFAMSNRLANMSSLPPNPEFYAMGR